MPRHLECDTGGPPVQFSDLPHRRVPITAAPRPRSGVHPAAVQTSSRSDTLPCTLHHRTRSPNPQHQQHPIRPNFAASLPSLTQHISLTSSSPIHPPAPPVGRCCVGAVTSAAEGGGAMHNAPPAQRTSCTLARRPTNPALVQGAARVPPPVKTHLAQRHLSSIHLNLTTPKPNHPSTQSPLNLITPQPNHPST